MNTPGTVNGTSVIDWKGYARCVSCQRRCITFTHRCATASELIGGMSCGFEFNVTMQRVCVISRELAGCDWDENLYFNLLTRTVERRRFPPLEVPAAKVHWRMASCWPRQKQPLPTHALWTRRQATSACALTRLALGYANGTEQAGPDW